MAMRMAAIVLLLVSALVLGGCNTLQGMHPAPTPPPERGGGGSDGGMGGM